MSNIIIIDLEMTCCENDEFTKDDMEVIEIGAVRICADDMQVTGAFQSFVKPVMNPKLTDFAKELLHISQLSIDCAPVFSEAWSLLFLPWLGGDETFCSWGKGDLVWLDKACQRHSQTLPFSHHCDLFKAFGNGQRRVLKRNGLSWYGQRHRALNDAITYAQMLIAEKPSTTYRKIR